jgi:YHS domain-containing protein
LCFFSREKKISAWYKQAHLKEPFSLLPRAKISPLYLPQSHFNFKMKKLFLLAFLFVQLIISGQTSSSSLQVKHFNKDKSNLAIQGYDPVNYFLGSAKPGSSAYVYTYEGITYRFVSLKNKQLFEASPSKFEPMYGGWCAYAIGANGEKVEVDPETFKILNGKLYLFYDAYFNNTRSKWNKDEKNLNKKADEHWRRIFN